jgi:hypothetical protein
LPTNIHMSNAGCKTNSQIASEFWFLIVEKAEDQEKEHPSKKSGIIQIIEEY